MEKEPRISLTLRKSLQVILVAVIAAILVISAVMLVHNARPREAGAPQTKLPLSSDLSVAPSNAHVLSTTTDTGAGSMLQGAASSEGQDSETLEATGSVSVRQLPPAIERVCDADKRSRLLEQYAVDVAEENALHERLRTLFSSESIHTQTSEQTRHIGELAGLENELTQKLGSIFCAK